MKCSDSGSFLRRQEVDITSAKTANAQKAKLNYQTQIKSKWIRSDVELDEMQPKKVGDCAEGDKNNTDINE